MGKAKYLTGTIAALLLAASPMGSARADEGASDDGATWRVAPMYLWAPSTKTDLKFDQPPVSSTSSFGDIISKVDIVLTGHVEAQNDKFGFFADLSYLALSDETAYNLFGTEASLDMTVFELAGVWSPGEQRYDGFEAFAGLRHFSNKIDAKFEPNNPIIPDARVILDKSFDDFMIGGRYTSQLSEHTQLTLRADASLGETGGTENFSAIVRWNRSGSGAWVFGYRYMNLKLDTNGEGVKISQYGPVIGYEFQF